MKRIVLRAAALILAGCGLIFLMTGNLFGREFNRLFPEEPVSVGGEGLPLSGKTVVCLGDSIIGMNRTGSSVTACLADKTGARVYNAGFGGTRMSVHQKEGYRAFSLWALSDAIVTGDWTWQEAEAPMGASYFPEQLKVLQTMDFSQVDILVLHYGTNDFTAPSGIPLDNGEEPLDITTLCGALRYSLKRLEEAFPETAIYVSLPVYRYWPEEGEYPETYRNSLNLSMTDYVQAMKQTAQDEGISIIDGYADMGMDKSNVKWMTLDGVHLSRAGRKALAQCMADVLTDIFP